MVENKGHVQVDVDGGELCQPDVTNMYTADPSKSCENYKTNSEKQHW